MSRTHNAVTAAVLLTIFGCTPRADPETQADLVTEEAAEGWEYLFDGKTLDGWRGYRSEELPPGWSVVEGAIRFEKAVAENDQHLVTTGSFENFELSLEWSVAKDGNSGIIYLAQLGDWDNPYETGLEMQVLDDEGHEDALNGPDRIAGALYDLKAPAGARELSDGRWTTDYVNPAGEWNEARIVVDGRLVEHWLNGVKALEIEMWGEEWSARMAESKWTDYPDFARWTSGHIALQDHDNVVRYRNIRIRHLTAAE